MRRCIVFNITQDLLSSEFRAKLKGGDASNTPDAVGAVLASRFPAPAESEASVPAPEPSVWRSLLRNAISLVARGVALFEPSTQVNQNGHLVTV